MSELKVNDGGTWRNITSVSVKDGGTWRSIQDIKVNDAGTWRTVWSALAIALTGHTVTDSVVGSPVYAEFNLSTGGVAGYATINSGSGSYAGEWMNPAAGAPGANYDVRWTVVSGSPSGSATGSWLNLGTARAWNVSRASAGTTTVTGTVEIRDASTLAVLATATITLTAQYL